ncbi:DUF4071 domain-containing protein [Rhizobium leguminosarum]|uniref:TRAFs-binding domain-containing protein n=1 Tax=Rhizobium leguminosarum TaxID=384 RepID=UPI001C96F73F|nr:TRAFs-binding domain-containing protein [Rhizobium leguminosarum]MBY5765961.1 DUF4071 domain-containing protein [Rhizobium leguminosarum]
MARRPLCFVLMPFGKKAAGGDRPINFDAVYDKLIKPAIDAAGLEPIRADEEQAGGIIHKPMFERLVLCEYAIADLTTANANVFYELGVRHAAKPRATVLMFAEGQGRLPFDVAQLRALPYSIGKNGGPSDLDSAVASLVGKLKAAKANSDKDSPLYQLLDDYPNIAHEKTDVFREQVAYAVGIKQKLADARKIGRDEIFRIEQSLGELNDEEAGVIVDLFLSYRSVEAWEDMVRIFEAIDPTLKNTILIREQLAFALNRAGNSDKAETTLQELIDERGASSETLGLLGRVYKDRWKAAKATGQIIKANGYLKRAIEIYRRGFEADWRDAYPGINALTLMHIANPNDTRIPELRSVVEYAVKRKIANGEPDYWDQATLLELSVLGKNKQHSFEILEDVLPLIREVWEPDTTSQNLNTICENLPDDDGDREWISAIISELQKTRGK